MHVKIKHLLSNTESPGIVTVKGWVKTRRDSKSVSFIEINDGTCLKNLQIIIDRNIIDFEEIKLLTPGSSLVVSGTIIPSPGLSQQWEMQVTLIQLIGTASDSYPLQKKRHSDEFLRTVSHLRHRTNKYGAVFRIRSELSFAIHQFFKNKGFFYLHSPILTPSDCEGAGELFKVTTMDLNTINGKADFSQDFFGKPVNLTVSGQLSAELFSLGLGNVYTFGPTFRAENSNTSRHASEFWMIEPEMAFCDLSGNMALAEETITSMIRFALENCCEDLDLFNRFVDTTLINTLELIVSKPFVKIPYRDCVTVLEKNKSEFQFDTSFGLDLHTEHERFLTETYFKGPVIVYDYPKRIKPFYMRINDDQETVAAMDVLVPRIGEIIGGSQREDRLDVLEHRMNALKMNIADYWWYLDSRRYGSVPHSGFGLGFERLLMLITGISNIRDVIPFPRTPKAIDF